MTDAILQMGSEQSVCSDMEQETRCRSRMEEDDPAWEVDELNSLHGDSDLTPAALWFPIKETCNVRCRHVSDDIRDVHLLDGCHEEIAPCCSVDVATNVIEESSSNGHSLVHVQCSSSSSSSFLFCDLEEAYPIFSSPQEEDLTTVQQNVADAFLSNSPENAMQSRTTQQDSNILEAAAHARSGQEKWRNELKQAEEEWAQLRVEEYNAHFKTQIKQARREFKSQKIFLLLKLQTAARLRLIRPDIDAQTGELQGFRVLDPHAFLRFFNPHSQARKAFVAMWRKFGLVSQSRCWREALDGTVSFFRGPQKGAEESLG